MFMYRTKRRRYTFSQQNNLSDRNKGLVTVAVVAGIAGLLSAFTLTPGQKTFADANSFTFVVVGDFDGSADNTPDGGVEPRTTMTKIGQTTTPFVVTTGDLQQDRPGGASAWCGAYNSSANKPLYLGAGNHEAESPDSADINDYVGAGCAKPNVGNITEFQTGSYPTDYYFDYPAVNPKIRVFNISPALQIQGEDAPYDYTSGSPRYNWISNGIDSARANGQWVMVAYHKPYLNAGERHGGSGGEEINLSIVKDLFNLEVSKKVDVILNGHEHNYMRSKQLALGTGCTAITRGSYNSSCVVNDGSSSNYTQGAGAVEIINVGAGSVNEGVGYSSSLGDAGFFAKHIDGTFNGYMTYTVSDNSLVGNLVSNDGSTKDTFTINKPAGPPNPPANPTTTVDFSQVASTAPAAVSKAKMTTSAGTCTNFTSSQLVPSSDVSSPGQGVKVQGGFDFTLACASAGGAATVDITLGAKYDDTSKVRVFKKNGNTVTDITSQVTVHNTGSATVITYNLTDGGALDSDGVADGNINDPVYVGVLGDETQGSGMGASNSEGGANGGTGALANTGVRVLLIATGATLLALVAGATILHPDRRYLLRK